MFSVAKKILVMINLRFRLSCRMAGALQISFVFYFIFLTFWCLSQMTVSVTGATGFIGKRLLERLQAGSFSISS